MQKAITAIFVTLLFCADLLNAQNYHFQNYSLEEGLPQSQVFVMLQDSRGSLWLGTNGGGLVRFNGNEFEVFRKKDGLPSEQIGYLFEDGHGRLWIGSEEGITIYDGLEFKEFQIDGEKEYRTGRFYNDSNSDVWFLAVEAGSKKDFKLYKYSYDSIICVSDQFEELRDAQLAGIFMTSKDVLYIGTKENTYELKGNTLTISDINELVPDYGKHIVPFYEDKKENLWLLIQDKENKVIKNYVLKDGIIKEVKLPEDLAYGKDIQFTEDLDGNFWIANNEKQELYHWINDPDELSFQKWSRINGLPDIYIRDILHDKEGNTWLATDGDGLFRMGGNRFLTFSSNPEIADKIIWSIAQDSKGDYWFGTSGHGVVRFDGEKFYDLFPLQKEPMGIIFSIIENEDGSCLFGTRNGLFEYNGNSIYRAHDKYKIPPTWINYILKDGDTYWFATANRGIYRYNKDLLEHFDPENSKLISNFIDHIFKDSKGNIWFAGRNGVSMFQDGECVNFSKENGLPDLTIMQIAEDSFGRIWVATYGEGIACIDPSNNDAPICEIIGEEEGLSSGNIYSLITDNDGNLWAGGQLGVDRVHFDENGKLSEIKNFDKYEGFTGIENNSKANLVDRDGQLWFGTINGVMIYNPEQENKNLIPPVTNIIDVKLSYREIDWTSEEYKDLNSGINPWYRVPIDLNLPYNKNHISFEFEGLSYQVPEKVRYQWLLDGIDEDWSPVSNRNDAIYSNLPPGNYTFKVKASNNDRVWNETPTEFNFAIECPFWATWWFRSLIVLFLVSVFITIFWLRNKFIRERQEELEHLVDFKTKKLQDQKTEILAQSEKLKDAYDNLAILSRLGRDITANLTIESIIEAVYQKLNTLMDASVLGIGVYNKKKNTIDFPGLLEKGKKLEHASVPFDDDQRLAVVCLKKNKEIIINNYKEEYKKHVDEWKPPIKGENTVSIIFIPLILKDKPIGVVTIQSFQENAYNENHLNIVRNLAIYTKIALENAHAYEKIREQAAHLSEANKNVLKQKDEIELKNLELLDLNNDKNHIISLVAHDLRNPLTSALTMAGVLGMENENLSEDQDQCVKIIEKGLNRMNDMIVRILDVRRIESQRLDLNMEKIDLQSIIKEVNNNLFSECKRKKIKINLKSEELYANLDKDFATQIFENLVSNAIKFSPPEKSIEVRLVKENGKARTEIRDEGPGLTKEDMKKLFGKFQRLSAKPTGGEHSTGIGLSIVKKYVEAMTGKVWCESEPGKGANFIVEFDRTE